MQTKKALAALAGNKLQNSGSELDKHRERYLAEYEQREMDIFNKKSAPHTSAPYMATLQRKLASAMSEYDKNVPVISKFDLYNGIDRVAVRSAKDVGLKRLATALERIWRSDSDGVFTYAQVDSLVTMYKDQYPRSKAADAIKAECSKSGMHKLPVAKLARIAAKVESQEDYDSLVVQAGLDTDRPDHVRSRAFIRGLVAAKNGGVVASEGTEEKYDSTTDRIASKLAALDKEADYATGLDLLAEAQGLIRSLEETLDSASMEMFDASLDRPGQLIQNLSRDISSLSKSLSQVQNESAVPDVKEAPAAPPAAPVVENAPASDTPAAPGFDVKDDGAPAGWADRQRGLVPAPTPTPEEEAGLKRKWYDPRTWGYKKMQSIIKNAYELLSISNDDAFRSKVAALASSMNKIAQMMPPEPDESDDDVLDLFNAPDVGMDMQEPMPVDAPVEQGPEAPAEAPDQLIEEIDDAARGIVEQAPPDLQSYVDHEMSEGHGGYPGTAEWGAEEILNEGHSAPPPSDQWMEEELTEMQGGEPMLPDVPAGEKMAKAPPGMEDVVMKLKKQYPGEPEKAFATAWSIYNKKAADGKGIPLPKGKVKSQPHVTTYAKNVKEDGAKTLKASEVEEQLLDGKRVSHAGVTIFVNDNNEIELWNKGAGLACGIEHFDRAIADFVEAANSNIAKIAAVKKASSIDASIVIERVANVPCEMCGTASVFPYVRNASHVYKCSCGHETSVGSYMELEKVAQMGPVWQMNVTYSTDPAKRKELKWRISSLLSSVGSSVEQESSNGMVVSLWNAGQDTISVIEGKLKSLGANVSIRRVAQVGGPNMEDVPEVSQDDVVDVTEDIWPEQDLLRQIKELKDSGMPYGQVLQHMIQMEALGTKMPSPEQTDYLGTLIMKARRLAKEAQAAAPAQPAVPAGDSAQEKLPEIPMGELAMAAFKNYKAQGLSMTEAMQAFLREHKERLQNIGNSSDGDIMGALAANYTSTPAAPAAPAPGGTGGALPSMDQVPPANVPPMSAMAAKEAQSKLNYEPKVNQQQDDAVSVKKDVIGPDSSTKSKVKEPAGKIKTQHKPDGKMSPTKLGPDSSTKAKMPDPGKIKTNHLPKDQSGTSLPDKKLNEDLSLKDPFKEPALGAKPSVSKK